MNTIVMHPPPPPAPPRREDPGPCCRYFCTASVETFEMRPKRCRLEAIGVEQSGA